MKRITLSLLTLACVAFAAPAMAADVMVASTMQRCSSNEECALVTNSCSDNCGFVPINKANLPALQQLYQTRCNKQMDANPACHMNPPIAAACVNNRCTIDYAYANNAGPKDYQAGAYPTAEAPAPDKVPAGEYSHINDRKGFTAYDLPQNDVRQKSIGELNTTVYVPPSAPVSGGNYVPVTPGAAAPSAIAVPVPYTAPNVAPTLPAPTPYAAPASTSAPYVAPSPVPANIPPAAIPNATSYATPPVMTPSIPNQLPQGAPDYVPPAPLAAAPVPSSPYEYVPAPALPVPTATNPVPAIGATGVPQAPAGSIPIPPSDLKPAPTFIPPTGSAIPVAPEDPGAPPPEGTSMTMKTGPDGSEGMTIPDPKAKKTFGTKITTTTKTTTYDTNQ